MAQFPSTTSASDVWNVTDVYRAVAGGNWPSPPAPDPYFPYVTMLLPGDGTNGAQNNTFLDSSASPLTITRNGNTTQGTFSPYGPNWSNRFNGSTDYFSVANNAALQFGTGDFTIESWVYLNAFATDVAAVLSKRSGAAQDTTWAIDFAANTGTLRYRILNSTGGVITVSIGTVSLGTWTHIAVSKQSGTTRTYLNGVAGGTTTNSTSIDGSTNDLRIGVGDPSSARIINGYISNARLVKGTAVYTAAFTPPTTPLTAISGTSLLTCQSNRFVDNSTNNFTLTATGTPSVQRFSPFSPTASYSTSVIGGSAYFDGSGDSLSLPNNVALDFGTGDFTIEVWIYPTSLPTSYQCVFITCNNTSSAGGIGLFTQSTGEIEVFEFVGTSAIFSTSGFNLKTNQWTNIAITRSGSTNTLYKNGVSFATATNSSNYNSSTDTVIGNSTTASQTFYGYISALRVLKGTAQAPTITTPPTNITNTSLLLNMTNGAIFDNAMMNDLETVGNAQISTSVVKYGTGSLAFDGSSGTYLLNQNYSSTAPPFQKFGLRFTMEMWVYRTSTATNQWLLCTGQGYDTTTDRGFLIGYYTAYGSGSIAIAGYDLGAYWFGGSATLTANTWHHVAVVGDGTNCVLYLNGTNIGSQAWPVGYTGFNAYGWYVAQGRQTSASAPLTLAFGGYIDDLRITNGIARYTANFTPPTAAFPTR